LREKCKIHVYLSQEILAENTQFRSSQPRKACDHGANGWQFGDGFESEDETVLDNHDREALYKVLLEEVLPTYYDNHSKWVEMMKASIMSTKDYFGVKRMLEEYYELLCKA